MHPHAWLLFTAIALVTWGAGGFLQKVSTDDISAESSLIWLTVGFLLVEPWLWRPPSSGYPAQEVLCACLAGGVSAFSFWALLEAMRSGGKAAVVIPLTSLYPLLVVLAAPFVLHEHITPQQAAGMACGLGAIYLLAV